MAMIARIFTAVFCSIWIVFLFIGLLVDARLIKNANTVPWSAILVAIILIAPIVFRIGKWWTIVGLDQKCDNLLQRRFVLAIHNTTCGGTPESREEYERISEEYNKTNKKLGKLLGKRKEKW